ncbi:MAG: hypothetical protein CUN54_09685, partial [Phototrophicales bacterium]
YIANENDAPLSSRPDYSRCEIAFIAAHEKVHHLDDVVLRRSLLGLLGYADAMLLSEVADVMAQTLGWTDDEKQDEIERTIDILIERHNVPEARLRAGKTVNV